MKSLHAKRSCVKSKTLPVALGELQWRVEWAWLCASWPLSQRGRGSRERGVCTRFCPVAFCLRVTWTDFSESRTVCFWRGIWQPVPGWILLPLVENSTPRSLLEVFPTHCAGGKVASARPSRIGNDLCLRIHSWQEVFQCSEWTFPTSLNDWKTLTWC
jgi:hypothetical protein